MHQRKSSVGLSPKQAKTAYLKFFSASTGNPVASFTTPSSAAIQAWHMSLANALSEQVQTQIIDSLNPNFYIGQEKRIRVLGFVTKVAEILRESPQGSIQFIAKKLVDDNVSNASENSRVPSDTCAACIFACVGWATSMYKADPQQGKPLAIDTQGAPCFSAPDLLRSFVTRSVAEILGNMGDDVLPRRSLTSTPLEETKPPSKLYVARLNFATLSQLANAKIVWIDTVSGHLNFDMANQTLFLFRFPSFCELHSSRNSVLAGILNSSSSAQFTVQGMMGEILMSYALVFKLNWRAQQLYKKEKAKPSNQLTDPLLDRLCLDDLEGSLKSSLLAFFSPKKESFDADAEFPIMSQRLLRIQNYIDGIPTNRISSLWKDRRDMSRWYTFWAVIWFGGASIFFSIIQTALAAESVQLAREQLNAQINPPQSST
ncbi:hypothetical protein HDV64DRAFT_288492 [Trichoderma sp. TUCIM 5745]